MSDRPLVSVIVIFFNAGEFLEEAIASVLEQSDRAWELLLVDDGSSDRSTAVARRHAARDPDQIRYLEHDGHENRGMSASRNLGAVHARGQYLFFLDADDVLRRHALATLCAQLEATPQAAMAYGPVEYWHSWPGNPAPRRPDFVQRLGVAAETPVSPPDLLVRFLRRDAAAPSGMLVRADAFRTVRGFEERFRGMYEDQAFCAKICLAHMVLPIGVCVYRYRQHGASSSTAADRSGEPDFGRAGFLTWLDEYLAATPSADPRVRRALRSEQRWLRYPRLHRVVRRVRRSLRRR